MDLASYLDAENETRGAFAGRIGVHAVTVSKWISGALRPSWPKMQRINSATGGKVTAADFDREPRPGRKKAPAPQEGAVA